jgi:hypothetical protein
MTMNLQDDELADRLHRATDPIDSPVAPDDLVRLGRAAVRRRRGRTVAAALSVAVLAVGVGGGAALLGGQDGRDDSTQAADQSSAMPSPVATSAVAPTAAPPSCTISSAGPAFRPSDYDDALAGYRAILVAHLDPGGDHLGKVDNVQGSDRCGTVDGLGTKLGWSSPGVSGLGVVQIEVNRGWRDSQIHLAHDGWRPAATVPAGAVRAFVLEYDGGLAAAGGLAVAVTRPDGITIALDANSLFGNNSTVPTSGMDFSVDQLLQTAADPGFQLS